MVTGGCHFQRALGCGLSAHVAQVFAARRFAQQLDRPRARQRRDAFEHAHRVAEMGGEVRLHAGHEPGPARVVRGNDRATQATRARAAQVREDAAHRTHSPVQRELTEDQRVRERTGRAQSAGGQKSDRDCQIERSAGLAQIGRSEVHDEAPVGQREAAVHQRRQHAHPGLAQRGLRQPDDVEARQAARLTHLDADAVRFDATEGSGLYGGDHATALTQASCRAGRSMVSAACTAESGAVGAAQRRAPTPTAAAR